MCGRWATWLDLATVCRDAGAGFVTWGRLSVWAYFAGYELDGQRRALRLPEGMTVEAVVAEYRASGRSWGWE